MTIDWNAFTPFRALTGGAMIGVAASLLVVLNGRIAGISGIVGGFVRAGAADRLWRVAFVAGILLAPLVALLFGSAPHIEIDASIPTLTIAGFLVGIGTRYGSGCTSGHGVCGLSRLSMRSIVATIVFMAAGFIMVYATRHLVGM
jgi:uncharacterized membrane protein YedE/YeeE